MKNKTTVVKAIEKVLNESLEELKKSRANINSMKYKNSQMIKNTENTLRIIIDFKKATRN